MNSLEISIPLELLEKSLIVLGKLLYQIRNYSASTYLASSAVRFLLKYYNKSKENTEKFFSTFIASLHLSSKVTEFAIPIRKFVKEISKINENKKYEPYLEMIGAKDLDSDDNKAKLVKEVAEQEMNIITTLNFDFTLPNPHERCMEFIDRIISWHYQANLIVKHFVDEDCSKIVGRMLHEIIINKDFYTLDLDLSTMVLAQLTLEHYGLEMAPGKPWYLFLNPTIDPKTFDNTIDSYRNFIFNRWFTLNYPIREEPKLFLEKDEMLTFIVYPVETYSKDAEPNCPPPIFPFYEDCVRSGRQNPTIYDDNYADHIPLCPPAPMEIYGDMPLPPFPYNFSKRPLRSERDKSIPIDRNTDLRHNDGRRSRDLPLIAPPRQHHNEKHYDDEYNDRMLTKQNSFPHSNSAYNREAFLSLSNPPSRSPYRDIQEPPHRDRSPLRRRDDEVRSYSSRRLSPPPRRNDYRDDLLRRDYWQPPHDLAPLRRDHSPPRRLDRQAPIAPSSRQDDRRDQRRYNDHIDDRGRRRDDYDRREPSRISHSRSIGDMRNSSMR